MSYIGMTEKTGVHKRLPLCRESPCYNPRLDYLVPKEGVEPSLPKEHEFESCASAYSATSA